MTKLTSKKVLSSLPLRHECHSARMLSVAEARCGIQLVVQWIPAFAGMTSNKNRFLPKFIQCIALVQE
ncbi:MAG: hypothetical protein H2058_17335 [Muricauda sp.]|nr:hypothetical protein [Allomuricauda sp.]MBA4747006.1 hypothetical protein [Allomuricauda sp.]